MGKSITAYLLTGSNLGDRRSLLTEAKRLIDQSAGKVVSFSQYYETAAWGKEEQPDFINQAIEIQTSLAPLELLAVLLKIEKTLGRERKEKWGQRSIDIDILFYGQEILTNPELTIPHEHLHERNFTLIPLMEIAAEF